MKSNPKISAKAAKAFYALSAIRLPDEAFDRLDKAARLHAEHGPEQHYEIIGGYTGQAIGCTVGSSMAEVLREEPKSTFKPVEKRKCRSCREDRR